MIVFKHSWCSVAGGFRCYYCRKTWADKAPEPAPPCPGPYDSTEAEPVTPSKPAAPHETWGYTAP